MATLWYWMRLAAVWWARNKSAPVVLHKVLLLLAVAAAVGFMAGRLHPEADYRLLQEQMDDLRGDVRVFAGVRESNEGKIRRLRLASELNERTLAELRGRLAELEAENLHQREETIFYRQVLGAQEQAALNIYALEETPGFRPNERRLEAVLVIPQKKFSGSYYFEAVAEDKDGGRQVVRVPPQDGVPLEFERYAEIEQVINLPAQAEVKKLKLVVHDSKGEIAAEQTIETADGDNGNGNGR